MKVTLEQISGGMEEVIIKYRQMTEQIEGLINYINQNKKKLMVLKDGQQVALPPQSMQRNCAAFCKMAEQTGNRKVRWTDGKI